MHRHQDLIRSWHRFCDIPDAQPFGGTEFVNDDRAHR